MTGRRCADVTAAATTWTLIYTTGEPAVMFGDVFFKIISLVNFFLCIASYLSKFLFVAEFRTYVPDQCHKHYDLKQSIHLFRKELK